MELIRDYGKIFHEIEKEYLKAINNCRTHEEKQPYIDELTKMYQKSIPTIILKFDSEKEKKEYFLKSIPQVFP